MLKNRFLGAFSTWFVWYFLFTLLYTFFFADLLSLPYSFFAIFFATASGIPLISLITLPFERFVQSPILKMAFWWPYQEYFYGVSKDRSTR